MQTTKTSPTTATTPLTTTFVQVKLEDRPGELGRCARVIADAKINLEGFNCGPGGVHLLLGNPTQALDVLRKNEFEADQVELFALRLPNQPGQLARIGEELGRAEVNVEACFGVAGARENGRIFVRCDNIERARPVIEHLASVQTTGNPNV